ncbi:site-specific integrase [Bradyrhizobium sp. AZCC 2230]|uniref:site-specific integrase n=1 Tax=Bradyrhizobium sp. AZCC 2230 TaxID=3117021 RepID=UPI002FF3E003
MTDEATSPLRQRMIEDMTIRKLAPKTQQGYIRTIKDFAAFLGQSPDTASFEDVRRFQLHLAANGAHVPILNHTVAALRFFFRVTLRRSDIIEHTTFLHEPRKLPVVLAAPPPPDWRFSDAGCLSMAMVSASRRPKTCTNCDIADAGCSKEKAARRRPLVLRVLINLIR